MWFAQFVVQSITVLKLWQKGTYHKWKRNLRVSPKKRRLNQLPQVLGKHFRLHTERRYTIAKGVVEETMQSQSTQLNQNVPWKGQTINLMTQVDYKDHASLTMLIGSSRTNNWLNKQVHLILQTRFLYRTTNHVSTLFSNLVGETQVTDCKYYLSL